MSEGKRLVPLILVMSSVALIVGAIAITVLYDSAFEEERERLVVTAQSQARLIEAVARFDAVHSKDFPQGSAAATLSQITDSHKHYNGFGRTGELTLAGREGDRIVFLLSHRHSDVENPRPVPFDSELAEPMRRALSGQSGTVVGLDYRGETVLAAHEPVGELNLGIVAKIDLAEVRAPFVRSALLAFGVAVVVVLLGSAVFVRVANPMLHRIVDRESRMKAILDTAVDAVITIDERGVIESLNKAAGREFGYQADELIGRNVNMLMPAPFREEHDGYIASYLQTGEAKIIGIGREVEAVRKDGTVFPIELAVSEVKIGNRRLFTGIVRDITERKQAEEAIRESQNFLQTIFDTEPECVKLLDPNGDLLMMNRAGLEMIEVESFDQVKGQCVYSIVAPEHRQAFQELTERVFRGESGTLEFEIVGANATRRRLDTHAVPLRDAEGTVTALLGITRDVTDKRRAEERALQAERLAAIGQMVTGLAHESRNAIQRAQACQEMLALDLEGQPDLLDLSKRTQRALDDLHRLYEEVRGYAAPIKLEPESCDLSELWRKTWANLEVARGDRTVRMVEETNGLDLQCRVDRLRVEQVFRNVLENALDVCPNPGEVVVRCAETEGPGTPALQIALCDNGSGLTSEQVQRIFEPFFSTKKKGTGLGMAIAKRIVEAHGGHIEVGDSGNSGAEIIVTLPRDPM